MQNFTMKKKKKKCPTAQTVFGPGDWAGTCAPSGLPLSSPRMEAKWSLSRQGGLTDRAAGLMAVVENHTQRVKTNSSRAVQQENHGSLSTLHQKVRLPS